MNLTVQEWAKREFTTGSRPQPHAIWRWIREGRIPATKLGKRYFIPASFTLNGRTGNALADKILEAGHGKAPQTPKQGTPRTPVL